MGCVTQALPRDGAGPWRPSSSWRALGAGGGEKGGAEVDEPAWTGEETGRPVRYWT